MRFHKQTFPWIAWLLAATAPAQETIRAGWLELRMSNGQSQVIARDLRRGSDYASGAVEVMVTEGPQKVRLADGDTLRIGREVKVEGGHVRWRAKIENLLPRTRLLEVKCVFTARFDGPVRWWDGHSVRDSGGARRSLTHTFPMTCAYAKRAGVAVGLRPDVLCSWLEQGWEAATPQDGRLSQTLRIVVGSEKSETIEFVLYAFEPRHGFLDALQVYYDEFPAWFRATKGVDPRVTGGGATYWCWQRNSPEMCRRFFGDWEWCYAPFRRTGDWYGREELWDYKPARPFGRDRGLPREEFLAKRAEQFERGRRCDVAMLFYLPANIWCEIQLANERYRDAIVLREDASGTPKPMESHKPWVTGHDDELVVFPWATSFAEACMRDMRQLAAELSLAGFAFDTANSGIPYRGPGALRCPGRAWDERGVFVDIGVAVALMEEFAHTLQTRDGRRCAVVSNPTGRTTWPVCFRSDAAMHEYAPYRQMEDQQSLRHM
ncbi:MAG: hypothetical protein N2689_12370, partial [Verrucomicrobiae bacterium]|nr:hypothetical protein [Verrucomicrobiae bacterium]